MDRMTKLQCMNCGENGHKFRYCPKPILSYGIACFIQNEQLVKPKEGIALKDWLCVCIQRRHTYSYVDYIRGKYDPNDREFMRTLLGRMTQSEIETIRTKSFDAMWEDLWMEKEFPKKSMQSKRFKQNASEKHNTVLQHYELSSKWQDTEWGLPKGRRNQNETDLEVAKREFSEETGIHIQNIKILPDSQMIENYVANNGHHYNNVYVAAQWTGTKLDFDELVTRNQFRYSFKAEISNIMPFTLTEILQRVRFYEKWKQTLFRKCFSVIHIKAQEDETFLRKRKGITTDT